MMADVIAIESILWHNSRQEDKRKTRIGMILKIFHLPFHASTNGSEIAEIKFFLVVWMFDQWFSVSLRDWKTHNNFHENGRNSVTKARHINVILKMGMLILISCVLGVCVRAFMPDIFVLCIFYYYYFHFFVVFSLALFFDECQLKKDTR